MKHGFFTKKRKHHVQGNASGESCKDTPPSPPRPRPHSSTCPFGQKGLGCALWPHGPRGGGTAPAARRGFDAVLESVLLGWRTRKLGGFGLVDGRWETKALGNPRVLFLIVFLFSLMVCFKEMQLSPNRFEVSFFSLFLASTDFWETKRTTTVEFRGIFADCWGEMMFIHYWQVCGFLKGNQKENHQLCCFLELVPPFLFPPSFRWLL